MGVFHTPLDVARPLAELALDELGRVPRSVTDPSVGGGALLLAVADALVDRGVPPDQVRSVLSGGDIDPLAVRVADLTLRRWSFRHGLGWTGRPDLAVSDALAGGGASADLVITNPPFGGRLRRPAASGATSALDVSEGLGPYADVATAFVLAADERTAVDGVTALVVPSSVLAARDVEAARRRLSRRRRLAVVWVDPPRFDGVAIAPIAVVLGPPAGPSMVVRGGEQIEVPDPGHRWSRAAAAVPPAADLATEGSVADVAAVLAPFRDEYYGLVDAVEEDGDGPRLVTSGLIDPGTHHWGSRPVRFAKRRFERPTVRVEAADTAGRRWIDRQLAPKVLVASQTRIIEAVADADGALVGVTPVIAVVASGVDVDHLLAVLLSPVAHALVLRESAGTGLNPTAIRVTGPALAALPLPADRVAWRRAAELLAVDPLDGLPEARRTMLTAYGLDADGELAGWWESDVGA
ncbi:MAG: N-6 DNA methylase [Actinomycetota bacterium]